MNYCKYMQPSVQIIGFLFLFCIVVVLGCSSVLPYLDGGESELIQGKFYDSFLPADTSRRALWLPAGSYRGIARIYQYAFDTPRFIRYIYLETLGDPIKNVDIYTQRNDTDRWRLVQQYKSFIDMSTRIDMNVRASKIRVVQKTLSTRRQPDDLVIGFKVYAQSQ